ncbi:dynein regulatory complex subunit 5 isoform X2 [Ischnura elegans]|uniref:dynein regulatory complex subunit 5 isoform X2 n=1 Tax=Ischnura elegans TaxID=197161 RepID=UPI001ED8B0DC|nr:dynein regulatory complex subunit 5 isoform X2 [Ischnura elegans]
MKIPYTVPKCAIKAYKPSKACLAHGSEPNRILKAEQGAWDELLPKSLSELAIDALIKNYAEKPIYNEILLEEDKNALLENLPLDLPLKIVIPIIPDGIYWQRRALERWPTPVEGTCDILKHNNSWRELYLERDIQEWIENLVPGDEIELGVMGAEGWSAWQRNKWVDETYVADTEIESETSEDAGTHVEEAPVDKNDMFGPEMDIEGQKRPFENGALYKDMFPEPGEEDDDDEGEEEGEEEEEDFDEDSDATSLKKIADKIEDQPKTLEKLLWAAEYIHHLRLRQLQVAPPDTAPPDDSLHNCTTELPSNDHIDLGPILCKTENLWELSIVYEMRNLGIDFAWHYFSLSMADTINLARGLGYCSHLKILRLQRSGIDDARLIILLQSIINGVKQLEILDVAHNRISNDGAHGLANLMTCHPNLKELWLCNNLIGPSGIQGISFALAKSPPLVHLDLRLNSNIGNEGGMFLCSALSQNDKLEKLILAACGLGSDAGKLMGETLKVNPALCELDLSSNDIGELFCSIQDLNRSLHQGWIYPKLRHWHLSIERTSSPEPSSPIFIIRHSHSHEVRFGKGNK